MTTLIDIVVPVEQEGTKAVVVSWSKQVGDTVALNEPLLDLETDKVMQEVAAPATGRLAEILLPAGSDAVPGSVLGRIELQQGAFDTAPAELNNESSASLGVTAGAASQPSAFSREQLMHYSPSVRRAAQEFGLDPATVQGTGRGGRVTRADMQTAYEQRQLQPLGVNALSASSVAVTESAVIEPTAAGVETRAASAQVSGAVATSIHVDQPSHQASEAATAPVTPSGVAQVVSTFVASSKAPSDALSIGSRKVTHSSMRLAIAKHMSASVATAPHVTAVFEADWTAIMRHRELNKAVFAKEGVNLSLTAYLVAACVAAMREVPAINSRWHDDALEIFDDINIGIGTALGDNGLVVPVIHKAQDLSLLGVARRLQQITSQARSGTLSSQDMRGGTFTISNHGVSGSLFASPIIINQPQSAILGVGKVEKRAVVREIDGTDAIQIRPMAYVSLTIDHRALDGHQTNAWLTRFVQTLEQWPLGVD